MRKVFIALTMCVALGGPHLHAQTASASSVLLFVDSLHIDFPQTPAIRRALIRAIDRLSGPARSIRLVNDDRDFDPFMIRPTTDPTELAEVANHVKGNGLKPAEINDPTPRVAAEMVAREKEALSTLQEAIMEFQPSAVIYISGRQFRPTGLTVPVFVTTPQEIDAAIDRMLQLAAIPAGGARSLVAR